MTETQVTRFARSYVVLLLARSLRRVDCLSVPRASSRLAASVSPGPAASGAGVPPLGVSAELCPDKAVSAVCSSLVCGTPRQFSGLSVTSVSLRLLCPLRSHLCLKMSLADLREQSDVLSFLKGGLQTKLVTVRQSYLRLVDTAQPIACFFV